MKFRRRSTKSRIWAILSKEGDFPLKHPSLLMLFLALGFVGFTSCGNDNGPSSKDLEMAALRAAKLNPTTVNVTATRVATAIVAMTQTNVNSNTQTQTQTTVSTTSTSTGARQ